MAQGLFVFYRFVKRKTLPSMEALPVVVLTDPISTGALLVDIGGFSRLRGPRLVE